MPHHPAPDRDCKKRREREPCSLKAWLLIALAVPSNLCDFNPLEITTPCKFQQQGIYFPTLNPLYTIYYLLFTFGILGWVSRYFSNFSVKLIIYYKVIINYRFPFPNPTAVFTDLHCWHEWLDERLIKLLTVALVILVLSFPLQENDLGGPFF